MIVIGINKIIIRNSYIYITFMVFHSVKKILFYLVFVGVKALSCFHGNRQTVPNIWCQIRKCFLSVISISQRLDKFEKGCSSIGNGMASRFNNIIHICRTPVIKNLKVAELMHCLKQSFMGSQLIFSNSVKPMWSLIFKFKQKQQIHLF